MNALKKSLFYRKNNSTRRNASLLVSVVKRLGAVAILLTLLFSWGTAAEATEPERWAIVVGIDDYFDLTPLTSSSKDAIQFGEVLKERCGFRNVAVVVDQPKLANSKAFKDVRCKPLQERLRNFIKAAEQNGVQTLVVYYSGHGCAVLNPNQQQPTDLLLPAVDASESNGRLINAISKNEIQGLLANAEIPEKLLILDCCHAAQPNQIPQKGKAIVIGPSKPSSAASGTSGSLVAPGASETKASNYNSAPTQTNSNFIVLAGSGFQQVAAEQVFTKYLVEGLSVIGDSAEDTDNSQLIEIDELFRFVQKSMSIAGGQRPSMDLITGKRDGIVMAPSIFQPDPRRELNVYVENGAGGVVSQANVKLVFFDNDRTEPEILATSATNQSGKAKLEYQFGTTRDRKGQFQIDVSPREQQYRSKSTSVSDFANRPSGSFMKIELMKNSAPVPAPPPRFLEPTHHEVVTSISEYVESHDEIPDICSFEKHFSDYHTLMKKLKRSDKFQASGITLCLPSVAYWQRNNTFRTQVLRILTTRGVINPTVLAARRKSSFLNSQEPSYNEVKKAAFGIIERMNADVCGLVDYVAGYKELIDTLDKSEKYEVLPGLTVCFPSKNTWDSKPSFRKKFVRTLRESFVLTK